MTESGERVPDGHRFAIVDEREAGILAYRLQPVAWSGHLDDRAGHSLVATDWSAAVTAHVRRLVAAEDARLEALALAGCEICREPVAVMLVVRLSFSVEETHFRCALHAETPPPS